MTAPPLSSPLEARLRRQIAEWSKDLLPTDRRQRALYFKHTRSASLELVRPALGEIAPLLTAGKLGFAIDEPDTGGSFASLSDLVVRDKTESELKASLRGLERKSREVFADRGFWTLYLGMGMLQWLDPDDGRDVLSPIVLVPVELRRSANNEAPKLSRTQDEMVINPVLALKLKADFGIELPTVDDETFDIMAVVRQVTALIDTRTGWNVVNRCVMTMFSFHKEAMYRDLLENADAIAANPLVQLIALGPDAPTAGDFAFEPFDDERLDEIVAPEDLVSILDADGSQRKCILAARDGRSFVMDGPPGTGKSQTIANIIVELIATGRTVLFVSEKAAALDVVRKRLAAADLTDYLLELHSHTATRKAIVTELDRTLTKRLGPTTTVYQTRRSALISARMQLTSYARAMNEQRPALGQSVHQILGRLTQLHNVVQYRVDKHTDLGDLDANRLDEYSGRANVLARNWRPVTDRDQFLWRGLSPAAHDFGEIQRMSRAAARVAESAAALVLRSRAIDDDLHLVLPLTAPAVQRRRRIIEVLSKRPDIPTHWLTRSDPSAPANRARVVAIETGRYHEIAAYLESQVGLAWTEFDTDRAIDVFGLRASAGHAADWRPDGSTTSTRLLQLLEFVRSDRYLVPMRETAGRLAAIFHVDAAALSPARAHQLARLAMLGASATPPEAAWLTANVQGALDESSHVLRELAATVREREQSLASVFQPEALELDLAALHARYRDVHKGLRRLSSAARADKKALKAVTVGGRVDKAVLARLEEAVTWQQAQSALSQHEPDHAPRLGRYYRGTATDFGRVTSAIETAHRAVELAGHSVGVAALASQIAVDGTPDPQLAALGSRFDEDYQAWFSDLSDHVGAAALPLAEQPFADVAAWCVDRSSQLARGSAALAAIASLAHLDLTINQATDWMGNAVQATTISATIYDTFDADSALLGGTYNGLETDWPNLCRAIEWADEINNLVDGPVSEATAQALLAPSFDVEDIAPLVAEWTEASDELRTNFDPQRSLDLRNELDEDLAAASQLTATMSSTAADDIDEWYAHRDARRWLEGNGLTAAMHDLVTARVSPDRVPAAVEHAVLQSWVDATVRNDSRLADYHAKDRDALVTEFHTLDRRLVEHAHAQVASACNSRRPGAATDRATAVIRREAQKKTRHKQIRQLLTETGELVQMLKPCFMMSPLSVSQYLAPGIEFDAVIFDEASQILPSDAITSVYRASQLIVAGDQKQLPPTSFFTTTDEEEGSDDEDDLDLFESLLDLSKAAGALQSQPLTWHYRSQHESLITYSNYRFYEGTLHTFPGAAYEGPDLGIELFVVPGVYRRGSSRDNAIEARAVVDRIVEHRRRHPALSLGVVTFSTAQEDAVVRAIEERADSEPMLADLLTDQDRLDGFFVKSLENVQGDERDIIIFTIGYGPDENKRMTNNFGPINRKGGWRRLNVAITRARRRVEVVSSFHSSAMPDSENISIRHLRGYLDFAERGNVALALDMTHSHGDAESPFEEDVLQVIRGWGYDAVPQVGAAGYRIDIGIKHPAKPGAYLLAVECDGAAYHSAKAARDRDRLREQVLRGLGWQVHRIWGLSWYRERGSQKERLKSAIEAALTVDRRPITKAKEPLPEQRLDVEPELVRSGPSPSGPPPWATAYREANIHLALPVDADTPEARPELKRFFQQVLAIEAPLHEELAMTRLQHALDLERLDRAVRSNAHKALYAATVDGRRVTRDEALFYRIQGRVHTGVRIPQAGAGERSVEQVPPEEIQNAVLAHVTETDSISPRDLRSAMNILFAWADQNRGSSAADRAIYTLINQELLRSDASGNIRSP